MQAREGCRAESLPGGAQKGLCRFNRGCEGVPQIKKGAEEVTRVCKRCCMGQVGYTGGGMGHEQSKGVAGVCVRSCAGRDGRSWEDALNCLGVHKRCHAGWGWCSGRAAWLRKVCEPEGVPHGSGRHARGAQVGKGVCECIIVLHGSGKVHGRQHWSGKVHEHTQEVLCRSGKTCRGHWLGKLFKEYIGQQGYVRFLPPVPLFLSSLLFPADR